MFEYLTSAKVEVEEECVIGQILHFIDVVLHLKTKIRDNIGCLSSPLFSYGKHESANINEPVLLMSEIT